jgi:hypothetical protein
MAKEESSFFDKLGLDAPGEPFIDASMLYCEDIDYAFDAATTSGLALTEDRIATMSQDERTYYSHLLQTAAAFNVTATTGERISLPSKAIKRLHDRAQATETPLAFLDSVATSVQNQRELTGVLSEDVVINPGRVTLGWYFKAIRDTRQSN